MTAKDEIIRLIIPLHSVDCEARIDNFLIEGASLLPIKETIFSKDLPEKRFKEHFGITNTQVVINTACFYLETTADILINNLKFNSVREAFPSFQRLLVDRLNHLWILRDNAINARNGFIIIGDFEEVGELSSTQIFTDCTADLLPVILTPEDAIWMHQFWEQTTKNTDKEKLAAKLRATTPKVEHEKTVAFVASPFAKSALLLSRIERSKMYLHLLRQTPYLPIKIANYVMLLECLFSNDNSELAHKVAERVAFFIGGDSKNKELIYDTIKTAYDIRSKFVHGQQLKLKDRKVALTLEESKQICIDMDAICRYAFQGAVGKSHIFEGKMIILKNSLKTYCLEAQ